MAGCYVVLPSLCFEACCQNQAYVPLIFCRPAEHVPDWQLRILLIVRMVENNAKIQTPPTIIVMYKYSVQMTL